MLCPVCADPLATDGTGSTRGASAWGRTACCGLALHKACLATWLAGGRNSDRLFLAGDNSGYVSTRSNCPGCRAAGITARGLLLPERPETPCVVLDAIVVDDTQAHGEEVDEAEATSRSTPAPAPPSSPPSDGPHSPTGVEDDEKSPPRTWTTRPATRPAPLASPFERPAEEATEVARLQMRHAQVVHVPDIEDYLE